MKEIEIDGIPFRVEFDASTFLLPRAGGDRVCGACDGCLRTAGGEVGAPACGAPRAWAPCTAEWHELARDLAFLRFESEVDSNNIDHVYTAGGVALLAHFVDSYDDSGREVPGGRDSGLHFPVLARGPLPQATRFLTGTMRGQRVVSILE